MAPCSRSSFPSFVSSSVPLFSSYSCSFFSLRHHRPTFLSHIFSSFRNLPLSPPSTSFFSSFLVSSMLPSLFSSYFCSLLPPPFTSHLFSSFQPLPPIHFPNILVPFREASVSISCFHGLIFFASTFLYLPSLQFLPSPSLLPPPFLILSHPSR